LDDNLPEASCLKQDQCERAVVFVVAFMAGDSCLNAVEGLFLTAAVCVQALHEVARST